MAHNINIEKGIGTSNIPNGTYSVTVEVNGYDNTSILPSSVNIVEGTNTYSFTVGALGTLTLHVTEDGTPGGTAIVGATFKRTDEDGNEYGSLITTDSNGDATFQNVPYAETNAPTIYYKQLTSDGYHEFSTSVASTTLTEQTLTLQIQNALSALRTINLTDANYEGLAIPAGTLNLE